MASYDSTNMRITDLEVGFLFEYDLKNWQVLEEFEYDWGNEFYTREFKVTDSEQDYFLELEDDDELLIALYQKISVLGIEGNIPGAIKANDEPPTAVVYNGIQFRRVEESPGYWRNVKNSNWSKFISWDYESADGKHFLTIERWGEEEFEASYGHPVSEYKFSNILPRENRQKRAPRDVEYERQKKSKNLYALLIAVGLILVLSGMMRCSSSSHVSISTEQNDNIIGSATQLATKYGKGDVFSIVLADMKVNNSGWSNSYLHQYTVVNTLNNEPEGSTTSWVPVTRGFYTSQQNNLGMEIISKDSTGKLNTHAAPAGYSNYIGNPRYGHWSTNSRGETFWSFYGKYMFMSSLFNMAFHPAYRNYYTDYRSNYYGRSAYYGPSSGSTKYYGTNSQGMKAAKPDFFERKTGTTSRSSGRTSRSSSRWGNSNSRSRSGGFGK